ncbi:MAG: arginase family protein [Desulfobacterales bacterium]|nr:MAG: arginase family protein [Desulfobacterales bacterium]
MRIEILGTPFNGLETFSEIENPAEGLRQANLMSLLEAGGHTVTDLGDLTGFQCRDIRDDETGINDFELWLDLSRELSKKVAAILDRQAFPLLLGGDCRMLIGIFTAFAERAIEVGLVFLDGHADFHSPETSPSGDPADMELAILTGRGPERITRIAGKYPLIKDENVVVYGIRAWDGIEASNIEVYDRQRMVENGIKYSVKEGLKNFSQKALPLWLHFDVDVLDPKFMPVMFPEPEGLTIEEAQELLGLLWASSRVIGMSIACYHPRLDVDGDAGARLVNLVSGVLSSPV